MSFLNKNYFELFSVDAVFEQDQKALKTRYLELQQELHPDRHSSEPDHVVRMAVDYAAHVNLAYRTLIDPIKRAIYLLKCRGYDWQDEISVALPREFLMEQMALRERLEDVRLPDEQQALADEIALARKNLAGELNAALKSLPWKPEKAVMLIHKMQFFAKLSDEIKAMETVWPC